MESNPRIVEMMRKDPGLFGRVNAARMSQGGLQSILNDQSVGQVMMELMGLG